MEPTEKLNTKSLGTRLKSKTPPFWKKVRKLMMGIAAAGAALALVPAEHTAWLPANLVSIMITIGAVGTALASLTMQDNNA